MDSDSDSDSGPMDSDSHLMDSDSDSGLMDSDSDSDSDSDLVDSDSLPDSRVRTHSNTAASTPELNQNLLHDSAFSPTRPLQMTIHFNKGVKSSFPHMN